MGEEFVLGEQFPYEGWFADEEKKTFAPSDVKKDRKELPLEYPWEIEDELDAEIFDVDSWF